MTKTKYILLFVFSLFYSVGVSAQGEGNVTVHADPRLSVLISRPHNVEPSEQPVRHRTVTTASRRDNDGATASVTVPRSKSGTSSSTVTVSNPIALSTVVTTTTTTTTTTAVKPLPGENGHAAGWTPPVRNVRTIYSGKGYRVQIFSGSDRQKASKIKAEFMRAYPGIRTYLTYSSPNFRVKVGDYRNRSDAAGMLSECNSVFNPSMIVPDVVTISTY